MCFLCVVCNSKLLKRERFYKLTCYFKILRGLSKDAVGVIPFYFKRNSLNSEISIDHYKQYRKIKKTHSNFLFILRCLIHEEVDIQSINFKKVVSNNCIFSLFLGIVLIHSEFLVHIFYLVVYFVRNHPSHTE